MIIWFPRAQPLASLRLSFTEIQSCTRILKSSCLNVSFLRTAMVGILIPSFPFRLVRETVLARNLPCRNRRLCFPKFFVTLAFSRCILEIDWSLSGKWFSAHSTAWRWSSLNDNWRNIFTRSYVCFILKIMILAKRRGKFQSNFDLSQRRLAVLPRWQQMEASAWKAFKWENGEIYCFTQ